MKDLLDKDRAGMAFGLTVVILISLFLVIWIIKWAWNVTMGTWLPITMIGYEQALALLVLSMLLGSFYRRK